MQRFILPITVLAALLVLLSLGTWQMQRLAWKEGLIAEREAGLSLPPSPLPSRFDNNEAAEAFSFRNVTVKGSFRHDLEQLYSTRAIGGVFGHHLLTPMVTGDGPAILIDRGWVPADKTHPASRPQGQLEGEVGISGIARFRAADRPGLFTPENDPDGGHWYTYDLAAMEDVLGISLSPLVIEADDTANPGGLPIGGRTQIQLANNHLQYAITWYGLAVALIGVYIVFRRQRKTT